MPARVPVLTVAIAVLMAIAGLQSTLIGRGAWPLSFEERQEAEYRRRLAEIAEADLQVIAEKARSEGKMEVVFRSNVHVEIDEPELSSFSGVNALVVVATGEATQSQVYASPWIFFTWYAFRIEEDMSPGIPSAACRDEGPASLADRVWIQFTGGSRRIAGVTVRHESGWPVPVRGQRYLIFGARCSPATAVLRNGPLSIYALASDDRIEPNPISTPFVQAVNEMGSLANVRRAVRP